MAVIDVPLAVAPVASDAIRTGPVLREAVVRKRTRRRLALPRPVRRLGGPLLLLLAWEVASATGVVDARTLAPPADVLRAGADLAATGELQRHLLVSLQRVTTGLALGVSAGVVLAVIAGLFRIGDDLVDSTMQVLRAIPVLGLLPLVILWFGIGEEPKILLVAVGTAFPVYINTHAGIRSVDQKLVETGTTFGLDRLGLVRRVILPGAIPNFLVGLRFSLTGAWLIMIIAEQINAREGIGYLMNEARGWYRTDIIVLGLAIYGILGLGADGIVRLLERALLSWRRGFSGA